MGGYNTKDASFSFNARNCRIVCLMPLLHKPTTERFAIPLVADLQVVSVLDHTTGIALTFTACWDRKINYRRHSGWRGTRRHVTRVPSAVAPTRTAHHLRVAMHPTVLLAACTKQRYGSESHAADTQSTTDHCTVARLPKRCGCLQQNIVPGAISKAKRPNLRGTRMQAATTGQQFSTVYCRSIHKSYEICAKRETTKRHHLEPGWAATRPGFLHHPACPGWKL